MPQLEPVVLGALRCHPDRGHGQVMRRDRKRGVAHSFVILSSLRHLPIHITHVPSAADLALLCLNPEFDPTQARSFFLACPGSLGMARLFLLASLLAVLAGCQLVTSQPAQAPLAKSTDPHSVREEAAAAPAEKAKPQRIRTELSSRKIETESMPAPAPASDPLTLAAECLSQGDDEGAAAQLGRHVAQHPDHVLFRAQLAEILARLNRLSEAQAHFEAAAALAQSGTPVAQEKLVHYHTRLMEMSSREDEHRESPRIALYLW